MPSSLAIITKAWTFYRKHPAINAVGFWLVFLPVLGVNLVVRFLEWKMLMTPAEHLPASTSIIALLLMLAMCIFFTWGFACLLLIGRRILQHNSGRMRTSLRAVARQARPFIIPLLLTGLLRGCITILWGLLLIVPGFIYSLSTSFYPITIVIEGKAYRAALNQSRAVLRGQWWRGIVRLVLMLLFLCIPPYLVFFALVRNTPEDNLSLLLLFDVLLSALSSFTFILFVLGMIVLYGELKKKHA